MATAKHTLEDLPSGGVMTDAAARRFVKFAKGYLDNSVSGTLKQKEDDVMTFVNEDTVKIIRPGFKEKPVHHCPRCDKARECNFD